MSEIYLVNYKVNGIKNIDSDVELSFYKKSFDEKFDTQEYRIKGIYGMNGSGKSGIITSVDILKNIILDIKYLDNPMIQKYLDGIINKNTCELFMEIVFSVKNTKSQLLLFKYGIKLARDILGKYYIKSERYSFANPLKRVISYSDIYSVDEGKIQKILCTNNELKDSIHENTLNLLENSTIPSLFWGKIVNEDNLQRFSQGGELMFRLASIYILACKIGVYMDQSDDHTKYLIQNYIDLHLKDRKLSMDAKDNGLDDLYKWTADIRSKNDDEIKIGNNIVLKKSYNEFAHKINQLTDFLKIFKADLKTIEIDKKIDHNAYVCNLIMVYESYKIHTEFESTGIKKLIKLYSYINEMVQGGIIFIDELDSNLHDVYLCAMLEYLMEYGSGQLCFTTHNVGPMDILKRNKKSIDFLSMDHHIYSWKKNGNYSPSKLYKNGMIEGSPFNVDSVDFIGVFDSKREDN